MNKKRSSRACNGCIGHLGCKVLTQYNHFIEKVREYGILEDDIKDAVSKAIAYCIKNHILEDFLREHSRREV